MNHLKKINANTVGVIPAYVKGMKNHGLCYFLWETANAVGAQCSKCNAIVWQNPRENSILNEPKPAHVPESGANYTAYYKQKITRYLNSQPNCPECGSDHFDLFVNNVNFPRFEDGTEFDESQEAELEERNNELIWWLD
ncbi:hypothetical protein WG68_01095 [Arsukibacterium ikkense]|uniref:Uncharacterized protein n=1 Tax=Arsukibacterium ikkense TaxID=336831 RepID=A0A0M2V8W0_9GAMM|nr:hypothetical protein [Arsukibacterium ikkense]KKO47272.1 hypothetical protein WG68_01095 [Arsukibacterium ikkense]